MTKGATDQLRDDTVLRIMERKQGDIRECDTVRMLRGGSPVMP